MYSKSYNTIHGHIRILLLNINGNTTPSMDAILSSTSKISDIDDNISVNIITIENCGQKTWYVIIHGKIEGVFDIGKCLQTINNVIYKTDISHWVLNYFIEITTPNGMCVYVVNNKQSTIY